MIYDVLVIGAGPAGLTAAHYSARSGYNVIVADADADFGGLLSTIPSIENYSGINKSIPGDELFDAMKAQAIKFGALFDYHNVINLKKEDNIFYATLTDNNIIESKSVILACGASVAKLRIPGEAKYRGKGVSYCAQCDGPFFTGKKVLVVGKDDSGLNEAMWLSDIASEVLFIQTGEKDNLNDQNIPNNLKFIDHNLISINGDNTKVTSVTYEDKSKADVDAVFIFIGKTARVQLATYIGADIQDESVITNKYMETNIPGFFAAGDVRNTPFKQISVAVGDGACAFRGADKYLKALRRHKG